jgi:hypothetical protein
VRPSMSLNEALYTPLPPPNLTHFGARRKLRDAWTSWSCVPVVMARVS